MLERVEDLSAHDAELLENGVKLCLSLV